MGKKKARIDKDGYVTFLNDEDGLSSKDYLLIISTGVFFGFVVIGLVMILLGKGLDEAYLELLSMTSPIIITVVGGTMGVQAVQYVTDRNKVSTGSKVKEDNSSSNEYQNNNNNYYDGGI